MTKRFRTRFENLLGWQNKPRSHGGQAAGWVADWRDDGGPRLGRVMTWHQSRGAEKGQAPALVLFSTPVT